MKTLKQLLHKICGIPRFRQRLLDEAGILDDTAKAHPGMRVQLVVLPFENASLDLGEMLAACPALGVLG